MKILLDFAFVTFFKIVQNFKKVFVILNFKKFKVQLLIKNNSTTHVACCRL